MDEDLKKQADELFADLGMNMTTAIVTFIKQAVREQAIPFVISRNIPNEETIQAIKGVERLKKDPNRQTYSSFDELLKEVEGDV